MPLRKLTSVYIIKKEERKKNKKKTLFQFGVSIYHLPIVANIFIKSNAKISIPKYSGIKLLLHPKYKKKQIALQYCSIRVFRLIDKYILKSVRFHYELKTRRTRKLVKWNWKKKYIFSLWVRLKNDTSLWILIRNIVPSIVYVRCKWTKIELFTLYWNTWLHWNCTVERLKT